MSGNTLKEQEEQPETNGSETAAPVKKGGNRFSRVFFSILDGSIMSRENAPGQISFLLFLFALATIYIGNGYYAEKMLRESNATNNDIKNMQGEYVSLQSKLAEKTRQSKIAEQLKGLGIGLRTAIVPPVKLVMEVKKDKK
jgi:Bacteriodetes cell division protein (FtsL-like)